MKPEIDISQLSAAECIVPAERLWDKARSHPEAIPVPPAQIAELNRRLDRMEADQLPPAEPWDRVKAWLRSR